MEDRIKVLREKELSARKRKQECVDACISSLKGDWYPEASQYLARASGDFAEEHICGNMASELQREYNACLRMAGLNEHDKEQVQACVNDLDVPPVYYRCLRCDFKGFIKDGQSLTYAEILEKVKDFGTSEEECHLEVSSDGRYLFCLTELDFMFCVCERVDNESEVE